MPPGPRRPRVAGARRPVTSPGAAPQAAEAPAEPTLLVVGRIGRPQGLLGEVTIEVRTDDPDLRFAVGTRLVTEPAGRGPLTVATARDHSGRLILSFEGIGSRTEAETLRDTLLQVDAATLAPPDDPDVFHDFQLVGLEARLADGTVLGDVVEVLHLPHGDVLAVRREGAPELLVPFVRAMVPVVDVAGGHVVIEPPEGLLDLAGVDPEPEAESSPEDTAGPADASDQD